MKKFIIHGYDGLYETFDTAEGESVADVERDLLAGIASVDNYQEIRADRFAIYETIGEPHEVDRDAAEAAWEERDRLQSAECQARQEQRDREDYHRLRRRFEKDKP